MNSPKAELRHPRSLAGPAKSVFRPIPQFCLLPSKFSSVTAKAPPEKKARSADAAESRGKAGWPKEAHSAAPHACCVILFESFRVFSACAQSSNLA